MRSHLAVLIPCAVPLFSWSCGPRDGGQSGAEVVEPDQPVTPSEPSPPDTISPGASECSSDLECEESAESDLASFRAPAPAPDFVTARCEQQNVILDTTSVSGDGCQCTTEDGFTRGVGPVGLGCHQLGRAGDCLFADEDFTGCELDDAASCDDDCALLEARLAEDAAKTFETSVVAAECVDGGCRNILEIDGRCYVGASYTLGFAYDCSQGVEAILEAYAADTAPPELIETPADQSPYVAGTDGTLSLTVSGTFTGTFQSPTYFSARADFVSVDGGGNATSGDVLDPLDGMDDCGARTQGGFGTAADVQWFAAEEAVLLDGDEAYPFEVYTPGFTFYGLDLTALGVEPRHGERYGFRGAGGTLEAEFSSEELTLPRRLSFSTLEPVDRVMRGALELEWTGSGEQPLTLMMMFKDRLADSFSPITVDCLLQDDGAYTIPADVLAQVPDGFVSFYARRRHRTVVESGSDSFVLDGEVTVTHELGFGEPCDTPEILEACLDAVDAQRMTKESCGGYDESLERPIEEVCPSFLATSCQGCVDFYECQTENLRCENGGLVSYSGCACEP